LAIAKVEELDLILMDVQMPVMDGIEATKRIRQLPPPRGAVAVFALTAHAMAPERARCMAAGMNLCLTKPIIWPDLFAALISVASRSPTAQAELPNEPKAARSWTETAAAAPLIDHAALGELKANIPAPQFQGLVGRALTGIEESCARMTPDDRGQLAQEAHRLRGTAGSFGFRRIAVVAQLLEEQMGGSGNAEPLITDLRTAARETRAALEECFAAESLTLY
jgi:HPt (histidine-containing phosphotransfer) domain-containing protein